MDDLGGKSYIMEHPDSTMTYIEKIKTSLSDLKRIIYNLWRQETFDIEDNVVGI